jgi:hypothetical protein
LFGSWGLGLEQWISENANGILLAGKRKMHVKQKALPVAEGFLLNIVLIS